MKGNKELKELALDVQRNTQGNDHTQALLDIAAFLNLDANDIWICLNAIQSIQTVEGHLPSPISDYRNELSMRLHLIGSGQYGKNWDIVIDAL